MEITDVQVRVFKFPPTGIAPLPQTNGTLRSQVGGARGVARIVQIATDVSADRVLPLTEGAEIEDSQADSQLANPASFQLYSSFPNPFRSQTTIRFDLPALSHVSLRIYDVAGRLVRVLENSPKEAGQHTLHWDAQNEHGRRVASGVYFYRLDAGEFRKTKKMMVLK